MQSHEQKVSQKYETLFRSENRFRKGDAYPIHKRLDFKELAYGDIYEWLIDVVDIAPGAKVLDAGCGVGYGSLLMASTRGADVHGISLSQQEVHQANANLARRENPLNVRFEVRSYDDVMPAQYDLIVAIESVKHSADLHKSLTSLQAELKPGGRMVIIEDLYQQQALNDDAKKLCLDYKLVDLFRASDYHAVLDEAHCEIHDLSAYVLPKIMWKIKLKLSLSDVINKLRGRQSNDITSILRGGYYLDRLYAHGLMKYKAIIYTAP